MSNDLKDAYVLHTRHYRESSGLVDFITRDSGRITLLAKGYKSSRKSSVRSSVQPFKKLAINWRGRGELKVLAAIEESGLSIKLEDVSLLSGFYLNELISRLLPVQDPQPELFDLYERTLMLLNDCDVKIEPLLRKFELELLELMGYGLDFSQTADGTEINEAAIYHYIVEQGPVQVLKKSANGVFVKGSTLISLARKEFTDAEVVRESKQLMRYILSFYLGSKPLKTRELFNYL